MSSGRHSPSTDKLRRSPDAAWQRKPRHVRRSASAEVERSEQLAKVGGLSGTIPATGCSCRIAVTHGPAHQLAQHALPSSRRWAKVSARRQRLRAPLPSERTDNKLGRLTDREWLRAVTSRRPRPEIVRSSSRIFRARFILDYSGAAACRGAASGIGIPYREPRGHSVNVSTQGSP